MYRLDDSLSAPTSAGQVQRVTDDVRCARCGYELRGLAVNQRCPECAAPVQNSMQAEMLDFAAPEFLDRLMRGALLARISAIVALCTVAITAVLFIVALAVGITSGAPPAAIMVALAIIWLIGPLACGGSAVIGWWLLTTPDPGAGGTRQDRRIRRVLRVGTVVAGVCWGLSCIPIMAQQLMSLPPSVYIPMVTAIGIALPASVAFMFFAAGPFLNAMAERMDDCYIPTLTTKQRWQGIGLIIAIGGFFLSIAIQYGELLLTAFFGGSGVLIWLFWTHQHMMDYAQNVLLCCRDAHPKPAPRSLDRKRKRSSADLVRDLPR